MKVPTLSALRETLDANHWPDEAGPRGASCRVPCGAAFLLETTGKVRKSHNGVRKDFLRWTKDDPCDRMQGGPHSRE